ncbi:MAG: hypothetical protein AAGD25_21745 [Cyanobacteria bacterium P01_F01_bin.150]
MRYSLTTLALPFALFSNTLIGAFNVGSAPAYAQVQQTQPLTADRAIALIQSEAAIQLNTFLGNTDMIEFSSNRDGQLLEGYNATVQRRDSEAQVFCSIDLNELVNCIDPTSVRLSSTPNPDNDQCGPERLQETVLDHKFTYSPYVELNDYSVRIYYNQDVVQGIRHLCMNVYDVRNEDFVGSIPMRTSGPGTTAYYTEQPFDGVDYQVVLNPDGSYMFRISQGPDLLYEGISR